MKKEFDFADVGKRLPYSVPEGFFEQTAQRVVAAVEKERKRKLAYRLYTPAVSVAVAASIALGVFLVTERRNQEHIEEPIENIIGNLSDEEVNALDNNLSSDYFLSSNLF